MEPRTFDCMSHRLLRFGLLVALSGSCYSAPKHDIPIDIFSFNDPHVTATTGRVVAALMTAADVRGR